MSAPSAWKSEKENFREHEDAQGLPVRDRLHVEHVHQHAIPQAIDGEGDQRDDSDDDEWNEEPKFSDRWIFHSERVIGIRAEIRRANWPGVLGAGARHSASAKAACFGFHL